MRAFGVLPTIIRAIARTIAPCLVLLASNAHAFCRTTTLKNSALNESGCPSEGHPLYWKNRCVGFSVQRAASRFVTFELATKIASGAFAQWAQSSCPSDTGVSRVSIDVRDVGEVGCETIGYDSKGENQNVILFRDDQWPHANKDDTLGLTTVTFSTSTGEILDADMEINTFSQDVSITDEVAPNAYDLTSIVQHESGHFLGLAHSPDEQAAMNAFYAPGESKKRYLKQDDVLGLCSAYLADGNRVTSVGNLMAGPSCDPLPRRGIRRDCSDAAGICSMHPTAEDTFPLATLMLGGLLLRRRKSMA